MTHSAELAAVVRTLEHYYLPARERMREQSGPPTMLHEDSERSIRFQWGERFLQALWNEQHFVGELRTATGQRLEVMSAGTWNVESGPDFRNAAVVIDGESCCGDIEVHRTADEWFEHGHHRDAQYRGVVLHVVWRPPPGAAGAPGMPCFVMSDHLDPSWLRLLEDIEENIYPYARQVGPGQCALQWAQVDNDHLRGLLRAAGLARLTDKATAIQRAAIQRGFEQALYECLFEALGFKANREPFRRLAAAVPLSELRQLPDPVWREAALFGTAALLPDPTTVAMPADRRARVRRLWDAWWPQGRKAAQLPWQRTATRPFNRPERRLAAGVRLLERCGLTPARWLAGICEQAATPAELVRRLRHALTMEAETTPLPASGSRARRSARVLGDERAGDILVNVILPFLVARGRQDGREQKVELAMRAYLLVPRLQSHRPLVEVVHRLLVPPSREREVLRLASEQQGLLAIYRDFCLALHNDCKNCPLHSGFAVDLQTGEDTVAATVQSRSEQEGLGGVATTARVALAAGSVPGNGS